MPRTTAWLPPLSSCGPQAPAVQLVQAEAAAHHRLGQRCLWPVLGGVGKISNKGRGERHFVPVTAVTGKRATGLTRFAAVVCIW